MAVTCPMCGSPPNTCNCIQNLHNYLNRVWGTSGSSSPIIPKYWEYNTPIEVWLNRLKQFPDLPTEYPEDFDLKRDIDFYLEAIHEMGDEEIYHFLEWIATQVEEQEDRFYANMFRTYYPKYQIPQNLKKSAIRSITVLDAFVIREYCNRLILAKNKELEEKEIKSRALAYEKSLLSTNFMLDDEIPSESDMAQGHNKRIRKQILILEELERRNEIPKKEVRRKIKELEKQYR